MSSSSIQQFLPRSCSLAALVFLVVMVVLAVCVTTTKADGGDVMSGGEGGEMTAMADAIKYLQGLDKVYGQAARPSIRGGKIVQLLQLKQLDRRYDNSLVRPRFGKRGRLPYFDMEDLPLHPQHAY
ncbi:uncharacterized protein LOC124199281 isoform X1 [Daphnia pulex]|uniref:uncharacterized protein LOC124199281 isoform X1 n=1 Tax=Daphnia pulex TaxID=6669 RepID=UPI001EDD8A8C|nr:uncharacterized protein LOC124199281 isoform X1 [Daphnia pulex]XP_046637785.1 uncharacterized protein LOC124316087 isoform X1 [Daphnia pulicaria]